MLRWPHALIVVGLVASACEGRGEPRAGLAPASHSRVLADKRAVFGDATLVPTRAGERARRELAIAGELEQALTRLEFGAAHVDVELASPIRVVVIARAPTGEREATSEATVAELGRALVPELTPEHLHIWLRPSAASGSDVDAEPDTERPGSSLRLWAMMLTCVGLGLSLGVMGERLRTRW